MTFSRRRFLQTGTMGVAAAILTPVLTRATPSTSIVDIAFLHLVPRPGDLADNRQLVERAITTAAGAGATWMLTPELCVCGYEFAGDCTKLTNARGTTIGFFRRLGSRFPWTEWRMGTLHPRHWLVSLGLQSHRTRPDARLYGGRERDCSRWTTPSFLSRDRSAIFTIEWDVQTQTLAGSDFQTTYL